MTFEQFLGINTTSPAKTTSAERNTVLTIFNYLSIVREISREKNWICQSIDNVIGWHIAAMEGPLRIQTSEVDPSFLCFIFVCVTPRPTTVELNPATKPRSDRGFYAWQSTQAPSIAWELSILARSIGALHFLVHSKGDTENREKNFIFETGSIKTFTDARQTNLHLVSTLTDRTAKLQSTISSLKCARKYSKRFSPLNAIMWTRWTI